MTDLAIGSPFPLVEDSAIEVLKSIRDYTLAAHDPPWSAIAADVPAPQRP